MTSQRQSNQIDVKDKGGALSLTATPGNSVLYQVNGTQQSRVGGGGGGKSLYNVVRGILIEYTMAVVRLTGGTTPIYADQFPRAISAVSLVTNMFGTLLDPAYMTGMVVKEITEFFGRGYINDGINRSPIPGVDGSYTRTSELFIPFSQGNNEFPDDFGWWLGWLDEAQLELFVNGTAQPFGISGMTITSVTFKATLVTFPARNLVIPPYIITRRYQQAASAASSGPILTNVGAAGGLTGVDDACRLESLLFSHQVGGFTGSGTADQITQVAMPWRDQANTRNINAFFDRFIAATGKPTRLGYTPSVTLDVHDNTQPYAMSTNPGTAGLADASARYTPLVFPIKGGQKISQLQKFKGNLPLDAFQFSNDQTNQFVVYTREVKQFSLDMCSQMLAAAGINPGAVTLIPKLGDKNWKKISADKIFCFPRAVVDNASLPKGVA